MSNGDIWERLERMAYGAEPLTHQHQIKLLLDDGNRIEAAKYAKEHMNMTLLDAVRYVDKMIKERSKPSIWDNNPTTPIKDNNDKSKN